MESTLVLACLGKSLPTATTPPPCSPRTLAFRAHNRWYAVTNSHRKFLTNLCAPLPPTTTGCGRVRKMSLEAALEQATQATPIPPAGLGRGRDPPADPPGGRPGGPGGAHAAGLARAGGLF